MQTLFLDKYQPKFFKDFVFDYDIIDILNTLIQMNNLNILFVGDIGTGKTSILNSVIREYYRDFSPNNYNKNILHINFLKEQGINYYRTELKTFCKTCSVIKGKKKIVLLDDIDLINDQGQQVFRNCIDKYSNNVHFISSCTITQKVIESIQSRFNIIKIKPLQKTGLKQIMNQIIENEELNIETDAKEFILNISNNNAKILINYMEKIKLMDQNITLKLASSICTNIAFIEFELYIKLLQTKKLNESVKLLYDIYDTGYSVMDILDNFFLFIKITDLVTETQKYNIIPIICKYIAYFHNLHEDEIELALFTNNIIDIL